MSVAEAETGRIRVYRESAEFDTHARWYEIPGRKLDALYVESWDVPAASDGLPAMRKALAYVRAQYAFPVVLIHSVGGY